MVEVIPGVAHGSWKRVNRELERLAYQRPNLSAIERQNGTARRMNAYLVRRSLAFGRTEVAREALGWFSTVVYNFCRTQRELREPLSVPEGRMLPAAHPGDGGEADRLELDGGRCALYAGLSDGRYGIITRYYHGSRA
jgi:hypothetical protein